MITTPVFFSHCRKMLIKLKFPIFDVVSKKFLDWTQDDWMSFMMMMMIAKLKLLMK